MEIVDPRVDPRLVPEGSRPRVINGPDREYQDLPSIRTPDGRVITRWALTDEERKRVLGGEDIYLTLLSHGAINPVILTVGVVDWTRTFE